MDFVIFGGLYLRGEKARGEVKTELKLKAPCPNYLMLFQMIGVMIWVAHGGGIEGGKSIMPNLVRVELCLIGGAFWH